MKNIHIVEEKEGEIKVSDKETSQKETPQKLVTRYDKKVQKRKDEEKRRKKEKKIEKIVGIVLLAVIAIGLLSIPVRKFAAVNSTYITIGDHDITKVEFDYYYNLASKNYISNYGTYLSYMGLDVNSDFSKQPYSETMTWKDYFDQLTVDSIRQNKALYDAALTAGFSYDTTAEYDAFKQSIKTAASQAGDTLGKYYKMTFGEYATESRIKPYAEESYVASAYYDSVADTKEPSEEEIQTYYDENTADYDSVDYLFTEVVADIPEVKTVTDGDGNASTIEPTEEEIQAAMDIAKKDADKALEVIATEGTEKTNVLKATISLKYSEWLFDDARKAGDTTIVEDTDSDKYYVLQFEKRYLNEAKTVNIRAILTTTGSGEDILAEWKDAGSTEDAFISLVGKYSEDIYTNGNGGLYEELPASSLDDTLTNWLYDDSRKAGDTTTVKLDTYTYVIYYLSEGRAEWQTKIASTLLNTIMSEWLQELKDGLIVSDPKGKLTYLKVQAAETATAETASIETASTEGDTTETGNTEETTTKPTETVTE